MQELAKASGDAVDRAERGAARILRDLLDHGASMGDLLHWLPAEFSTARLRDLLERHPDDRGQR